MTYSALRGLVLATAATALLSACDRPAPQRSNVGVPAAQQQQTVYRSLDACLAEAKDMDAVQACRAGYEQAMQAMANAPRYDNQATCEDVYGPGNCVPRGTYVHDGGSGFMPFMMGFWMGGGFGHSTSYYPVYVDRMGTTYSPSYGGGSRIVSAPSWSGGAPATAARAASSSVSRGGFGSTAMASAGHAAGG